ncbi:hypothetical protein [Lysinibacillus capsici]|uniref:hypothetical protein n=1 Tax=Lysinibacillus capsici TaxID=2115968 RepID=UPI002480CA5D|nr:hypothetical protein [Lysinibacillus capsici]
MKELYYTGLIFFCLGSLMLFLHHLVSSAVRHLATYMGEPIPLNNGLYIPSVLFIVTGIVLVSIYVFNKNKKI